MSNNLRQRLINAQQEIALLNRRLSTAVDKQILLMNRLIELEDNRSDDARGKPCPDCSTPMVSCATHNERYCVGCGSVWEWTLAEGQLPLIGPSRQRNHAR